MDEEVFRSEWAVRLSAEKPCSTTSQECFGSLSGTSNRAVWLMQRFASLLTPFGRRKISPTLIKSHQSPVHRGAAAMVR